MKIAILGTGNVGTRIGTALSRKGHEIIYGSRTPVKANVPNGTRAMDLKNAVKEANIVFLAVPGAKTKETIIAIGPEAFKDKVVVDVTNVPTKSDEWAFQMFAKEGSIEPGTSNAEENAKLIPGAKVVKTFNMVFAENMDSGIVGNEKLTLFIAGNDKDAKERVEELGESIGFDPVDVGELRMARHLESMGMLLIKLGYGNGMGTSIGFRLVRKN